VGMGVAFDSGEMGLQVMTSTTPPVCPASAFTSPPINILDTVYG